MQERGQGQLVLVEFVLGYAQYVEQVVVGRFVWVHCKFVVVVEVHGKSVVEQELGRFVVGVVGVLENILVVVVAAEELDMVVVVVELGKFVVGVLGKFVVEQVLDRFVVVDNVVEELDKFERQLVGKIAVERGLGRFVLDMFERELDKLVVRILQIVVDMRVVDK